MKKKHSIAKKVIDMVFKGIDSCLADLPLEKLSETDIEEDGVAGKYMTFKASDDSNIEMKLFGVEEHPGQYIVRLQHDGKDAEQKNKLYTKDQLADYISEYAERYDIELEDIPDINESTDIKNSKKISVTLQRVAGSTEDTIELCAINAGSHVSDAMDILSQVLDNDEFAASITEEPVSFDIVDKPDCLDVQEAVCVDTTDTFTTMLRAAVECYYNLKAIHWGAKSDKFNNIHQMADSLGWSVSNHIDRIAEWEVEYNKRVPNVLDYQYQPIDTADGFDFERGCTSMYSVVTCYINTLECYYVNVDHTIQSVLDDWIRELKQAVDYKLYQTRSDTPIACPSC